MYSLLSFWANIKAKKKKRSQAELLCVCNITNQVEMPLQMDILYVS